MSFVTILQILINSLFPLSIVALSTFAIILIFKTSTTTNFAQGTISTLGAFSAALIMVDLKIPVYVAIPIGVLIGFLVGWFIDSGIIRRAKIVTPVGKQMITMGIVLLLSGLMPILMTRDNMTIGSLKGVIRLGSLSFVRHDLLTFAIAAALLTGLFLLLKFSKWGLAVRATADNEKVATLMGVNTRMITALSWSIAGGLGSIAAILYLGKTETLTSAEMAGMGSIQIQGFVATVLGGFSTFYGPVIGAVLINVSKGLFEYRLSEYSEVIVYMAVLVIVLIKPLGLFGKKVIKKV